MNLKVLVADDEPLARAKLKHFIGVTPGLALVGECRNGSQVAGMVAKHKPHIVLLDVRMPKLNGVEVARTLGSRSKVIFVTAHREYAVPAFELAAADYLLKPFTLERFRAAMHRVALQLRKDKAHDLLTQKVAALPLSDISREGEGAATRILLRFGEGIAVERLRDIVWASAEGNYVSIYALTRRYFVRGTMQQLSALLQDSCFVRIHRSRLVNMRWVKSAHCGKRGKYLLTLETGHLLRTGGSASAAVENAMAEHSMASFGNTNPGGRQKSKSGSRSFQVGNASRQ